MVSQANENSTKQNMLACFHFKYAVYNYHYHLIIKRDGNLSAHVLFTLSAQSLQSKQSDKSTLLCTLSFLLLNLTFCLTTAVKCFKQIVKCVVEQLSRHFIKFPQYMLGWITCTVRFVSRFCRCPVFSLSLLPLMAVGSQCSIADWV